MLYSGVTGKISIKKGTGTAVEAAHIASFNVELSKEIIEVVSFGDEYKEKIPSIKDWTASADGAADFATAGGQKLLYDAFEDGAKVEAVFYLDTTTFFTGERTLRACPSTTRQTALPSPISLSGSGGRH